jgi:hypothetical protein
MFGAQPILSYPVSILNDFRADATSLIDARLLFVRTFHLIIDGHLPSQFPKRCPPYQETRVFRTFAGQEEND